MNNNQTHCQCPNCSSTSSSISSHQIDIRITSYGERTSLIHFPKKTSLICCLYDDNDGHSNANCESLSSSIGSRLSLQSCDEINEIRCNGQLCDVVVKCDDGAEFFAHKVILSG